jgi:peroxiredoxin
LAIAVDPPDKAREVVERNRLDFPILCDTEREVITDYGLVHRGGGPDGSDIAVPAHILIDGQGRVVWRFVARRVEDRPHPNDVIEAVQALRETTPPTGPSSA